MDPIDFEGSNCVFAEDQPEYLPLPVRKVDGKEGEVISVWKPTLKERLQILIGANIGLSLWTFHGPLTPSRIFVDHHKEKNDKQKNDN